VNVRYDVFIPKELQNLVFDCASIPTFAAASIDHVQAHGLLPRRLRLLQIWGASTQRAKFLPFRLRQSPYNRRSQVDSYCTNTDQLAKPAVVDSTELSRQPKRQKLCSLGTALSKTKF